MEFLKDNIHVLGLSHNEMPVIDSEVMVHRLTIDINYKPIQQKRRAFTPGRYKVIWAEFEKLK